eukprot:scaffold6711_cov118-Isochrysis_galbana.AAC.35
MVAERQLRGEGLLLGVLGKQHPAARAAHAAPVEARWQRRELRRVARVPLHPPHQRACLVRRVHCRHHAGAAWPTH